ncbi:MAG TPA: type II toxin-antitoxin system HicB family antitoxin [Chloroflexota bacterium]|jgi:predicted RNase H-like HicB family nuclease
MRRYTVVLIPDPDTGAYTVQVPALPECVTQGETVEDALENARDVIRLTLESRVAHGEPIPIEPEAVLIQVAAVAVDLGGLDSGTSAQPASTNAG